ncbi:AAA family ATPase [Natrialbaceae archaeon A-CW3]
MSEQGYFSKAVQIFVGTFNKFRDYLKKNYFRTGEWNNLRNVVASVGLFFGLAFLFAIPSGMIASSGSEGTGEQLMYLGMFFSFAFVAGAFIQARGDTKARIKSAQLYERANPKTAAQARQYLTHYDHETRNNAMHTIAIASQETPGKVVKQVPVDVNTLVAEIVTALEDRYAPVRVAAAEALTWYSRDYPEAVAPHTNAVIDAMSYTGAGINGNMAIVLGLLGRHDPSKADEFAKIIAEVAADDDPDVRRNVAIGLSKLDSNYAKQVLRELADDNHPGVHEIARNTLASGNHGSSEEGSTTDDTPSSSESQTLEFISNPPNMDFDDIAGMDDLKARLQKNIIDPFTGDSSAYEKFGVGAETGVLLHGPPGTGKTHIAQCIAGELDANYAQIDVGDIESKWIGEGVENISQLFAEVRQSQPAVVFIDEIDAIAADRNTESNMHENQKRQVNQLLQEVSNISPEDEILVIAATNRPENVDNAMKRPGRFDSKIEVPKPDPDARWAILHHELPGDTEPIPRERFVRETSGFSSSDIIETVNRAKRKAANRQNESGEQTEINIHDVFDAVSEIADEQSSMGTYIQDPPQIDFDDVVGMSTLKDELHERVIDPLENPEDYEKFGLSVEHGFLLYGPPGTGKTYISKALAGELGINYIEAKAGDIVSKWIGQGAENVQEMFEEACEHQPTLVFIDEIDALASDRGMGGQSKSERQMVNQFLEELSSIDQNDDDVVVIGATNRLDDIDDAMMRAGRLGETIEVPPPDAKTRVELFKAHLEAPCGSFNEQWLAQQTENLVASDMERLASDAARAALKRSRKDGEEEKVIQQDLENVLAASGISQKPTESR